MDSEKTPIWQAESGGAGGTGGASTTESKALFHTSTQGPKARAMMIGSVIITSVMVIIALSLCIYQGVKTGQHGFLYFLIGVCLIGFIAVEIILMRFLRSGDLAPEKAWFLYFLGFCIFLESIFTDVLVMH